MSALLSVHIFVIVFKSEFNSSKSMLSSVAFKSSTLSLTMSKLLKSRSPIFSMESSMLLTEFSRSSNLLSMSLTAPYISEIELSFQPYS